MGFFSKFFAAANDLAFLQKSVSMVVDHLDEYDTTYNEAILILAAYIYKVGVFDIIEKNNWPPYHKATIRLRGRIVRMSMMEIQSHTLDPILSRAYESDEEGFEEFISDIIAGGPTLNEVEKTIPQEIKNILFDDNYYSTK